MKVKVLCSALLIGLMVSPAIADIAVSLVPQDSVVELSGGPFTIDIVADIPEADKCVGWGLDLTILDPLIADFTGSIVIGPSWTPAAPSENKDSDGLAGLAFPDGVFGDDILLATVEFQPLAYGTTGLELSDDYPADLTEGFALWASGFATVNYGVGSISVIPEPATLTLLVLGGLAALRRR